MVAHARNLSPEEAGGSEFKIILNKQDGDQPETRDPVSERAKAVPKRDTVLERSHQAVWGGSSASPACPAVFVKRSLDPRAAHTVHGESDEDPSPLQMLCAQLSGPRLLIALQVLAP